jgi:hypothetical protein
MTTESGDTRSGPIIFMPLGANIKNFLTFFMF